MSANIENAWANFKSALVRETGYSVKAREIIRFVEERLE